MPDKEPVDKVQGKQPQDEMLEFLKRGEVRTMEKDIAVLRKEEAQTERERIVSAPKAQTAVPLIPSPPAPAQPQENIAVPLPQKPAERAKIFTRILILLIVIGALAGIGWIVYSKFKNNPRPASTPAPTPKPTPTPAPIAVPQIPLITEKLVSWGYRIPKNPRTIDTIIIFSAINSGKDPYGVDGIIQQSKKYKVSPHYLIARDGTMYRLVPDEYIAYHAGTGQMPDGSRKNVINNFSIGIELVYAQVESPNNDQYASLARLVAYLAKQYNIPSQNILEHKDISPGKKTDPWNFDLKKFRSLLINP